MKEFRNWREIMEWADAHGYKNMAERMELNNTCWNRGGVMDAIEKLQTEKKKLGAKFRELHKAQLKYFAKQDMDGVAEFRRRKEDVIELARGLDYAIAILKNS